jgi:putative DNA primase/helicase
MTDANDVHRDFGIEELRAQFDAGASSGTFKQSWSSASGPTVQLTCGSNLKPKPISWAWCGWLARGKAHILGGQPGSGKTTIAMRLAATVTKGGRWPDGTCHVGGGNVVIWSGEDDPQDTLVPRLIASGADMDRILFVDDVVEAGKEQRAFDPAKDIVPLRAAIRAAGGAIMINVDPIVSAVSGDSHKNGETRRALQPLVDLASDVNAALIGITHFSKGTSNRDPLERITGSIAFGALARVVMVAAKEAVGEDGLEGRRILARAKSNIGPDQGGFTYSLVQVPVPGHELITASIVEWGEGIAGSARDMLAVAEAEEADQGSALREAKDFLVDLLSEKARAVKAIQDAARLAGHSPKTLRRAKDALGVVPKKTGMTAPWEWSLPEDDHQNPKVPTPETWAPS